MEWPIILALVLGIPIALFPVAYISYLNIGGIYSAIKASQKRKATPRKGVRAVAKERAAARELVGTKR